MEHSMCLLRADGKWMKEKLLSAFITEFFIKSSLIIYFKVKTEPHIMFPMSSKNSKQFEYKGYH